MDGMRNHVNPRCPEFEERAAGQPVENKARTATTNFIGDEDLRTSRALRVRKLAVLPFDEKPAQRNHEQYAEQTTGHGQQGHLQQLWRHAPHE